MFLLMEIEITKHIHELKVNGFAIIDNIFSNEDVRNILQRIEETDTDKETFRKSSELFAIRQLLKEVPGVAAMILPGNNDIKSKMADTVCHF